MTRQIQQYNLWLQAEQNVDEAKATAANVQQMLREENSGLQNKLVSRKFS